ncbi:MAG: GTPase ObgE [Myxococcales bacterium]|nr:GTPase ObgE [Myxococcales bacterium]
MKHSSLFVDEAEIEVQSGAGGDGIVAFRREKYVPKGGPNGGDGGRGGDIVLVADPNVSTLLDFKHSRRIKAPNGQPGGGSDKKGASGDHVEVHVPVGTLVFDVDDELPSAGLEPDASADPDASSEALLAARAVADLTEPGQRVVVARGGIGGLGNARFKTSTRQAPDFATPGKPGESRRLRLSLKLMADVGLVGFPNAGKSTLLRRISAARPRVASYPFTTLVPSLGVVDRDDRRCVVADIPGLIEGASEGAGLGHQFLRHVERTRVLIHLLDVEAMLVEGRDLVSDYDAIRTELGRYRPELLDRREILVLNKCDLIHDESLVEDVLARLGARGLEPIRISAAGAQGIETLLTRMFDAVDAARADEAARAARDAEGEAEAARAARDAEGEAEAARDGEPASR